MKTIVTKQIEAAAEVLLNGGIIGMPTETVYGLGGIAYSEAAVKEIYRVKQRPFYNPLILHICGIEQIDTVAAHVPEAAYKLAREFWPGPMTLVLPKKTEVPGIVTAGHDTVAIRVPAHPVAQQLLKVTGGPVAAPSANPFGRTSPTTAAHVLEYFEGQIPLILDGGPCEVGIESTIIGFDNGKPVIYRQGTVTEQQIVKIAGKVDRFVNEETAPRAPGMLSRHYAPKTPMVVTKDPVATAEAYMGKHLGIISFSGSNLPQAASEIVLSPTGSLKEAAANLYRSIHQMDNAAVDLIIAEEFPATGIGAALNDKLHRASKR